MHAATLTDSPDLAERLRAAVLRACPRERHEWLEGAFAAARAGRRDAVLVRYTGVARRLRSAPSSPAAEAAGPLVEAGLVAADGWSPVRLARAALLVEAAVHSAGEDAASLVEEIYRTGDNEEREALLGVLGVLARADRYLDVAVEACRSNVAPVFAAIACENPYPARWFSEVSFNQMVLKAMFTGVALARIHGLESRRNAELARMARDYADERRAAARAVPPDIALAIGEEEAS